MTSQPLVSVVIPTYNRACYIRECIDSVLCQTYPHVEILVIDDGSTDQTASIMADLVQEDPRVKSIYQANAGVSAARNHGMRIATGDYIALLDSDDAWYPWKLELQLAALQQAPEAGMIWSDMSTIDESSHLLSERHLQKMYGAYQEIAREMLFTEKTALDCRDIKGCPVSEIDVEFGNIYASIIRGNLVHTSTVLMTKDRVQMVKGFDEKIRPAGEDYAFHLATCRYGNVAFLDIPTTLYRVGLNDQITHQRNQVHFAKAFLNTIIKEISEYREKITNSDEELNEILLSARLWVGRELADDHFSFEAISQISRVISSHPFHKHPWFELMRAATPSFLRSFGKSLVRKFRGSTPVVHAS